MAIRPFRPDDLEPVAALMRQAMGLPAIDASLIARDILLDPGFAADHLLVADAAGGCAGFVLAPRLDPLGPAGTGWIAALGVRPDHQRRGIGRTLVEAALAGLRRDGATRVDVADMPVRYLLPGIDREAHPAAYRLLTDGFGFQIRDSVASMGIGLADLAASAPDAIRACAPGEIPLLRAFLTAEFEPGWWAHLERSIRARLSGDPTPSAVLCHWEHGLPVGAVHYRGNRFGPLAVASRLRGRGVGAELTRAALAEIRRHGFADAYFLVARPEVEPFYARLGFRVLRRFTRLTLAL